MNTVPIDVRAERLEPPERLTAEEKELWEKLVQSRRPGWFSGSEALLETYVTTTVHCQAIEVQLRKATPKPDARYERLARLHRQTVSQCASLARQLRLTTQSRIDKRQRHDGDEPLSDAPSRVHVVPDAGGEERSFAALRAEMMREHGTTVPWPTSETTTPSDAKVNAGPRAGEKNDGEEGRTPAS